MAGQEINLDLSVRANYTESMGSKIKNCEQCGKEFRARLRRERGGYAKYCSMPCYRKAPKSEEMREKLRQDNLKNPRRYWLDKKRSEETKQRISSSRKGKLLGKSHPNYQKAWAGEGESHVNWTGGRWLYWRNKALQRDDYTCQSCGLQEPSIMHVDHTTPLKGQNRFYMNHDLDDLLTLCPNCHARKTNIDRGNKWQKL